jgi:hypothetical protein
VTGGSWRLVHCDDLAIVTATRENGQCVVRFVQFDPLTTWTFAIDGGEKADHFLSQLAIAWAPKGTMIGPAPAAAEATP